MKKPIALLLWVSLTSCSTLDSFPSISVSVKDLEDIGNPELKECQILQQSPSLHPCVFEIKFKWSVNTTTI